jgi:hypothetical protein
MFVFWFNFMSSMAEKLKQPYFVESVGLVCLFFWFRFLSSLIVERVWQPCFVENMGGVDKNVAIISPTHI